MPTISKRERFLVFGIAVFILFGTIIIIAVAVLENRGQQATTTTMVAPQTRPLVPYVPGSIKKAVSRLNNPLPLNQTEQDLRQQFIKTATGNNNIVYQATDFRVEYNSDLDFFEIAILSTNIALAKQEAVSWLVNQGLDIKGICNLPVTFYLDGNQTNIQGGGFDPNPIGC